MLQADAIAPSFRRLHAVEYRLFTTTSSHSKPLKSLIHFTDATRFAVILRNFSTCHTKYELNNMHPAVPCDAVKLSDIQNNAADDMKVADIDLAQTSVNLSAESSTDDGQDTADSGKFLLSFKCKPCDHRMMRFISKQAYRKGVVIVRCESCTALHLMADNLGWFRTSTGHRAVNVEQLLAEKGEVVKKVLSELRPDDVRVLQENMNSIIDVPDSLRPRLGSLTST